MSAPPPSDPYGQTSIFAVLYAMTDRGLYGAQLESYLRERYPGLPGYQIARLVEEATTALIGGRQVSGALLQGVEQQYRFATSLALATGETAFRGEVRYRDALTGVTSARNFFLRLPTGVGINEIRQAIYDATIRPSLHYQEVPESDVLEVIVQFVVRGIGS